MWRFIRSSRLLRIPHCADRVLGQRILCCFGIQDRAETDLYWRVATGGHQLWIVRSTHDSVRSMRKPWRKRFDDFMEIIEGRDIKLLTTREDWESECTGAAWCPRMRCSKCEGEVTSLCINRIQQGRGLGCKCSSTQLWSQRYDEFVAMVEGRDIKLLTTREDWGSECTGAAWCPRMRCSKC